MKRLEGKVAVVTGRNSGIGLAAAKRLQEECGNQFLSLKRISKFSPPVLELEMQSQHCNSRSVQIRNVTESCGASPPERDSGCPLAASGNNRPHRVHFQGRWFPPRMGFGRDGNLHVMAE